MSDYEEFKKVLFDYAENIEENCESHVVSGITLINEKIEKMIKKRDERIKELESKSSPEVLSKPVKKPDLEKPKTIEEYYDLLESKRKLLFSYWQNKKVHEFSREEAFNEFEKFYKKMKNDYGQDVNIIALKKNKRLSDEVKMDICHEVNQKYSYMIKKYNITQKDVKPGKVCPPGKIINPKTGRCINKPKEKTQKRRGRPKKFDKPVEPQEKPKKDCPPGKIVNPKTGRCINKPKEKTHKRRGRPKKTVMPEKSKSPSTPPVSNYYQKQYEKFMKTTEKDDLKEAFVEKVEPEPEVLPRRNPPRGFFSTTVSGPRTRKKPQYFS